MDTIQTLRPGATLRQGTYRIERVLGRGGFGITYLATDLTLDKTVAVKEFFPDDFCIRDGHTSQISVTKSSNVGLVAKLKSKFLKEARNIARLECPGIIRVLAAFEENDTAYYVMDYIEGLNLSEMVKREGPLPADRALHYIREVGDALELVHSRNMTHLDVKPANILVRARDDMPVLIDFGLSKQYDHEGHQTSTTPTGISHGFAPIEQYYDEVSEFSPQTDLYSLAATLYYLLSGVVPPPSTKLAVESLPFPSSIPSNLIAPISKAMSMSKTGRHGSIREFVNDLLAANSESEANSESAVNSRPETKGVSEANSESAVNNGPETKGVSEANSESAVNSGPQTKGVSEANSESAPKDDLHANATVSEQMEIRPAASWTPDQESDSSANEESCTMHAGIKRNIPKWIIIAVLIIVGGIVWLVFSNNEDERQKTTLEDRHASDREVSDIDVSDMLNKGNAAFEREDYTEAFEWFYKAAKHGDSSAQYNLGFMYYNGYGVDQDYSKALSWFRNAAKKENSWAQFYLGSMYFKGDGVDQDYSEAERWFRKAAVQGDADAQYNLGIMYENGLGVDQDYSEAQHWYSLAAEQTDTATVDTTWVPELY